MQYLNQSDKKGLDEHPQSKTLNVKIFGDKYYNSKISNSNIKTNAQRIKSLNGSNTYIKIPSVIVAFILLIAFGCVIYTIAKSNKEEPDSSLLDSSLIAEDSEEINDSSSIIDNPDTIYSFEEYKQGFQNEVESQIDSLFNDGLYVRNDIVEVVHYILDNYFTNTFRVQSLSEEVKETLNNGLCVDGEICDIFHDISDETNNYNKVSNDIYDGIVEFDCNKANMFTSLMTKYKQILSYEKIPPYAINRLALITGSYATALIRNYDKAIDIGFSIQDMVTESLDSIYYYIWDLSFSPYNFNALQYNHDISSVNYLIGLNFVNLSQISVNEKDKVKYNCMAIYFFDKSYSENFVDNENHTPTFLKGLCYYNLSNLTFTKNYRNQYLKKSKELLDNFIKCNVETNRKEAIDILEKISNQLIIE